MTILMMLALLLLKHYIADFVLQTPYQLRNKGHYGHLGGLLHAFIHMVGTLLVLLFFVPWQWAMMAGLADGIVHYHIDWIKEKINHHFELHTDNPKFWMVLGADQLAHQLTYCIIVFSLVLVMSLYEV